MWVLGPTLLISALFQHPHLAVGKGTPPAPAQRQTAARWCKAGRDPLLQTSSPHLLRAPGRESRAPPRPRESAHAGRFSQSSPRWSMKPQPWMPGWVGSPVPAVPPRPGPQGAPPGRTGVRACVPALVRGGVFLRCVRTDAAGSRPHLRTCGAAHRGPGVPFLSISGDTTRSRLLSRGREARQKMDHSPRETQQEVCGPGAPRIFLFTLAFKMSVNEAYVRGLCRQKNKYIYVSIETYTHV